MQTPMCASATSGDDNSRFKRPNVAGGKAVGAPLLRKGIGEVAGVMTVAGAVTVGVEGVVVGFVNGEGMCGSVSMGNGGSDSGTFGVGVVVGAACTSSAASEAHSTKTSTRKARCFEIIMERNQTSLWAVS